VTAAVARLVAAQLRRSVACLLAFGIVAALVVGGVVTRLDQWAVDHLMPWLTPAGRGPSPLSVVLPFTGHPPPAEILLFLAKYPASIPVSGAVLAAGAFLLWRRGARAAAVLWLAAWLVGNAVEVAGKTLLHRPPLHMLWHGEVVVVPGFADSFPSGHAFRAVLVAGLVGAAWPRLRPVAWIWLAAVPALLVVTNAHAPFDVVAGCLLGAAARPARAASSPRRVPVAAPPPARRGRSAAYTNS
jgi:membrane-associated phospholipid phosphatase